MLERSKKISSETVNENPWWKYKVDNFELPSGSKQVYHYIETLGAALCVPINDENKLVLVRQYRCLTDRFSIEFPMGGIKEGEKPGEAAKRELEEETGLVAEELIQIGTFEPSNGVLKDTTAVYLARELSEGKKMLDEQEETEVLERRPDEFAEMVTRGEITDGQTLAAWSMVRDRLLGIL